MSVAREIVRQGRVVPMRHRGRRRPRWLQAAGRVLGLLMVAAAATVVVVSMAALLVR